MPKVFGVSLAGWDLSAKRLRLHCQWHVKFDVTLIHAMMAGHVLAVHAQQLLRGGGGGRPI